MLSGVDRAECIAECYKLGARHFLVKPRTFGGMKKLVEALYEWLIDMPAGGGALASLPEYRAW